MSTIDQKNQIKSSRIYEDDYGTNLQLLVSSSLEDDLNAIRTQLKKIIGKGNWYSSPDSPNDISLAALFSKDSNIWSTIEKSGGSSFSPDKRLDSFSIEGGSGISVTTVGGRIVIKNDKSAFDRVGISSDSGQYKIAESVASTFRILGDPKNGYIETVSDGGTNTVTVSYVGPQTVDNSWYYIQSFDGRVYERTFPDADNDSLFIYGRRGFKTSLDINTNTVSLDFVQNLQDGESPTFSSICITGYTEGSVLFSGANGEVQENNTALFWDDSKEFWGIGTDSPEARLHVSNDEFTQNMNSDSETYGLDGQFYGVPRLIGSISGDEDDPPIVGEYDQRPTPDVSDLIDGNTQIVPVGNLLYGVARNESGSNTGSIFVIDTTFSNYPYFLGGLGSDQTRYANCLAVKGKHIYVGFTDGHISSFDVSDPTQPVFITSLNISFGSIVKIDVHGNMLIAASGDGDLVFVDIRDPENFEVVFNFNDESENGSPVLTDIQDMFVNNGLIYLVSSFDGLSIYNIKDIPRTLQSASESLGRITIWDTDGTKDIIGVSSIYVSEKIAYMTIQEDLGGTSNRLVVMDVSSSNLDGKILDEYVFNDDTTSVPIKFVPSGRYAYALYRDAIRILDISDLENISIVSSYGGIRGVADGEKEILDGRDLALWGKYGFVSGGDEDNILFFDLAGLYASTSQIYNLQTKNLIVNENIKISNIANVSGDINIGFSGLDASGPSSVGRNIIAGEKCLVKTNRSDRADFVAQSDVRIFPNEDPVDSIRITSGFDLSLGGNRICKRYGDFLYILDNTNSVLNIIDVSVSGEMTWINGYGLDTQSGLSSVFLDFIIINNNIFFITETELVWYDLKYPAFTPSSQDFKVYDFSSATVNCHPRAIEYYSGLFYIGGLNDTVNAYTSTNTIVSLLIRDFDNEDSVVTYAFFDDSVSPEANECKDLKAYNGYLYYACNFRIIIYNIQDTGKIVRVGSLSSFVRDYIHIYPDQFLMSAVCYDSGAPAETGLELIDIKDPTTLSVIDNDINTNLSDAPSASMIVGDAVYVSNAETVEGLSIFSLTNFSNLDFISNSSRTGVGTDGFDRFDIEGNNLYSTANKVGGGPISSIDNLVLSQDLGGVSLCSASFDFLKANKISAQSLNAAGDILCMGGVSSTKGIVVNNEVKSFSGFTGQYCCYVTQVNATTVSTLGSMYFGKGSVTTNYTITNTDGVEFLEDQPLDNIFFYKDGKYKISYNFFVLSTGSGFGDIYVEILKDYTQQIDINRHITNISGSQEIRGDFIIDINALKDNFPAQSTIIPQSFIIQARVANPSLGSSNFVFESGSSVSIRKIN